MAVAHPIPTAPTRPIERFTLQGPDGVAIAAYRALPEADIRGVVQIAHGMAEHFGRYHRLAGRLTRAGYAVYANDHRGHGGSAGAHGLGQFGPAGFAALVGDMAALTQVAKREAPGQPLVLLGHSMGSFTAQLYLLDHHRELAGLVLSGTAALDKLLENMLASGRPVGLESLNAGFEPARTPFDWLTRDAAEVDAYVDDPLCGFALDGQAMGSIFALGSGARTDARLAGVRGDLPIYVISGEHDPVTGPGQAFVEALIGGYQDHGLSNIEHRIYPEGRHEMFNETCRDQVESELIVWLNAVTAPEAANARGLPDAR